MKKWVIISLFSMTVALSSCGSTGNSDSEEAVAVEYTPVEVYSVESNDIQSTLEYSGVVSPAKTVNIISTITSEVENTYFEVGDTVNEGDLLFTVDSSKINDQIKQLDSQLQTAEIGVQMANNTANNITGGAYQSQLLQLESGIESTKKQLELAEQTLNMQQENYENGKVLYDSGIISKSEFEGIELAYNQAKSAYESTQLALEQQQETYDITANTIVNENKATGELSVEQAMASRDSLMVQMDITQKMLDDASVYAPMSGVISFKGVNEDEYVSSQKPAYTIVDMDTVLVSVKVSEKIINNINKGDEVEVYISTIQDEPFIGTIKTISPVADQTSTYPIEIEIQNPNHTIKPGMFTTVSFVLESENDAIVLPVEAVLSNVKEKYVYVDNNGVAEKVVVETGINNGEYVEITSGLEVGDNVITKGQSYVENGENIKVIEDSGVTTSEETTSTEEVTTVDEEEIEEVTEETTEEVEVESNE